jgi:opacity protein-like surface antigen
MIRKSLLLLTLLLAVSATASAQDHPKVEVYGTYNLLLADIDIFDDETLHGWGAGVQGNLNSWFGVVAEFGGNYGSSLITPSPIGDVEVDTSVHTIFFGPRVSYRHSAVTVFAHYLVGPAILKAGVDGVDDSNTEIGMAVGGGVDINLGSRFALRAGQFDYVPIHSDLALNEGGSSWFRNFRYQAGIVVKF